MGRLHARHAAARATWGAARRASRVLAKALRPFPCAVALGAPEVLIAGVREKYAHPAEVAYQTRCAADGLEAWETSLFTGLARDTGRTRVLVVGAGAGRESLGLARLGFDVVGIDLVPALVAAATQRAVAERLPARFVATSLDALPKDQSFDIVISSGGVYEHTPTRARRIALLRALADRLAPGGAVALVAGWNRDRGPRYAVVDGLRWVLARARGDRFTTEPGDRLIRHLSLASSYTTTCFFHVFQTPDAITREIEAAGLAWHRHPEGAWIIRPR
jgi:SAM-dependent methyltransferase